MKNANELIVATEESAKFIDAALADNGKPDLLDLFRGMPMATAIKDAVLDVTLVPGELSAASEEEIRDFGGRMAVAQSHLIRSSAALVEAIKPV